MARACSCRRRSRVRVPVEEDTKPFADVGNLTTSVSAGLSKDSGSIHFIHTIQSQEQHNNTPYKRVARWNWISVRYHQMSFAHFLLSDQLYFREKGFLLQVTHDPLYDLITRYHPLASKWRLNRNKINKYIIIIILLCSPRRQHFKELYHWKLGEEERNQNTEK